MTFIFLLMTGAAVPVNRQFRPTPGGVPVFVVSNGAHTDLVLPVRDPHTGHDWLRELNQPTLTARFGRYSYVGFGWGNEGFFLGSMGGRTPGPGAVLRALLPSATLVHANFTAPPPIRGRWWCHSVYRRPSTSGWWRTCRPPWPHPTRWAAGPCASQVLTVTLISSSVPGAATMPCVPATTGL